MLYLSLPDVNVRYLGFTTYGMSPVMGRVPFAALNLHRWMASLKAESTSAYPVERSIDTTDTTPSGMTTNETVAVSVSPCLLTHAGSLGSTLERSMRPLFASGWSHTTL